MAYAAKSDGAWIDKTATGGTATSNLIDAGDCNRWEANQADSNTRLTALEGPPVHAVGNSGTTLTLDAASSSGYIKTITLTGNCTFTLTGASAGRAATLELVLTQDVTGGRSITWPSSVKWSNAAIPTISTAAASVSRVILTSYNGGTTWYGDLVGVAYA